MGKNQNNVIILGTKKINSSTAKMRKNKIGPTRSLVRTAWEQAEAQAQASAITKQYLGKDVIATRHAKAYCISPWGEYHVKPKEVLRFVGAAAVPSGSLRWKVRLTFQRPNNKTAYTIDLDAAPRQLKNFYTTFLAKQTLPQVIIMHGSSKTTILLRWKCALLGHKAQYVDCSCAPPVLPDSWGEVTKKKVAEAMRCKKCSSCGLRETWW